MSIDVVYYTCVFIGIILIISGFFILTNENDD